MNVLLRSPAVWAYLLLYATMLALLWRREGFSPVEPLFALVVLGGVFSAAAWLATRKLRPLPAPVRAPGRESAAILLYLVVVAGYLVSARPLIDGLHLAQPAHVLVVTAGKLLMFVVLPWLLMHVVFGYRWRELAPVNLGAPYRRAIFWMTALALLFQSVFGRGLRDIMAAQLPPWALVVGLPLAYLFLTFEVGVVEEFLFRALLQSRLAQWFRSEGAAVVTASLLFGLVHAPGLYLRPQLTGEGVGAAPSVLMAIGYSVVFTSTAGFFLGVLWSRTRNFAVPVLVHVAMDWLPNLVPFLKDFHLISG